MPGTIHDGVLLKGAMSGILKKLGVTPARLHELIRNYVKKVSPPNTGSRTINSRTTNYVASYTTPVLSWRRFFTLFYILNAKRVEVIIRVELENMDVVEEAIVVDMSDKRHYENKPQEDNHEPTTRSNKQRSKKS